MGEDIYTKQSNDWDIVQGDTKNISYTFRDSDGTLIDFSAYDNIKFSVKDPHTDEVISALDKTHNDAVSGGDGIYILGDAEMPAGLSSSITTDGQIVIVLTYTDTSIETGVYPFDLEVEEAAVKHTVVKGTLVISEEITPSV